MKSKAVSKIKIVIVEFILSVTLTNCNGKAERGFSQQSSINNVNYITKNKSYKLPNGVIVLSEEDMILFNEGKIEY